LQHRLQLNVSAYYMEWLDSQIALYQPCCLGNSTFTTNGANYDVKGVEIQAVGRPMAGLTLSASTSYNDNTQANAPCLIANAPTAPFPGACITQVKGQPYPNPFGVKGGVTPFAPALKGAFVGRYEWTVMDAYHAFASLDVEAVSHEYNEPANYISGDSASEIVPNTTYLRYKIPGYATLGGSIGFAKDQWTVSVVGSNLLDSHASTFTSSGQFIKAETPLRPRVVGLHVAKTF
jgi:outer membrane receptor protein involved in Fe transport